LPRIVGEAFPAQEIVMSDYRDPYSRDPMDPAGAAGPGIRRSNSGLGWIAGAVFLVIVLALIFGLGRSGEHTASTGATPPGATTGMAPAPGGSATVPRTTTGQSSGQ
jgi:hypothetical protein